MIANKAINNNNSKESYMHTALLKKYFRLAVGLLKFKTCKNFLNSKPPEDDQSFLFMQQMHLKEKKDLYKNLELEKRLNQSKNNEETNTDVPEKMSILNTEEKNKLHKKNKIGSINPKINNNTLKIEVYGEVSNVNSSSLYSSKISKTLRYNSFNDLETNFKYNPFKKEIENIIPNNLRSYSFRERISNIYRENYLSINENSLYSDNSNDIDIDEVDSERINYDNLNNNKEDIVNEENNIGNKKEIEKENLLKFRENSNQSNEIVNDSDSLFHPENTKNKKNLNEIEEPENSFGSNVEFRNENPDILILRENEMKNHHTDKYNKYDKDYSDQGILAEIGPSSKFENNNSDEGEGNNFFNTVRKTLKKKKNANTGIEDSDKNFNYMNLDDSKFIEINKNFNRLHTQKSIKKQEEENKGVNSDFMINVQSILIDNLRYQKLI